MFVPVTSPAINIVRDVHTSNHTCLLPYPDPDSFIYQDIVLFAPEKKSWVPTKHLQKIMGTPVKIVHTKLEMDISYVCYQ